MREENRNNQQVSEQTGKRRFRIQHWEVIAFYLVLYDAAAVNASYFFALLLRFDMRFSQIPQEYLSAFVRFIPFYTVFAVAVFYALHLYSSVWRFASFSELNRITVASLITAVFHCLGITFFMHRMPVSYYIIGAVMQYCLVVAVRFSYRYITMERARRRQSEHAVHNAMIIGAGAAGQVIIRELKNSEEAEACPRCVIDDVTFLNALFVSINRVSWYF